VSSPISAGLDLLIFEDLEQQRLQAARIAAAARRAGLSARIVDAGRPEATAELVALARSQQPQLLLFSVLFAGHVDQYLALAAVLRQAGVTGFVSMAGPLPAFAAGELLVACPALDGVFCGEAEATVGPLAVRLASAEVSSSSLGETISQREKLWEQMSSLLCRSGKRAPLNPKLARDFEDEPWPARDDAPLRSPAGYCFATVEGSRGCYHSCTFCLPCAFCRATGAAYRPRSIPDLCGEIAALYRQGARLFLFDDEQFLAPGRARNERVAALGRELSGRELKIGFTIKCRPDDVEPDLFALLKDMGLLRVYVGLESGCQASLDLFGKGVTPDANLRALQVLTDLGIIADFRLLMFHPWSTHELIREELAFLHRALPYATTAFSFHEVEIYPGTVLGERMRREDRFSHRPWPVPYVVEDARVEWLRAAGRLLFGAGSAYYGLHNMLSAAWYDLLMDERILGTTDSHRQTARRLTGAARTINEGALGLWQEIMTLCENGNLSSLGQVERRAAGWAEGLRTGFPAHASASASELSTHVPVASGKRASQQP
jgi:anaerobic magnesium-protoporphyrin IX monomethyl ester cyclase